MSFPVRPDEASAEFFEAAAGGELLVRQCENGHFLSSIKGFASPAVICPSCQSERISWVPASGRATLVSWTIIHQKNGRPPSLVGLVELEEGPWMYATLSTDAGDLQVGQSLAVGFFRPEEGEVLPLFRPA